MQSNILQRVSLPVTLCIRSSTGQITQVRNHVKIYPWRFNRLNRECYLDNTKTPYTDRTNINEFRKAMRQRKDWQRVVPKDKDNRFNAFKWNETYKSDPVEAKETAQSRLLRLKDSLEARGSARESIPYEPPDQVQERILNLFRKSQLVSGLIVGERKSLAINSDEDILGIDLNQVRALKFSLITKCIEEFQHDMPTSYLNEIQTVQHVVEYFSTSVRGTNPYTAMLRKEDSLPVNLHLIADPMRFDKETDQFFQGYNAYPGLVCKVAGLRAAKKHRVLNQDEFQWPDI